MRGIGPRVKIGIDAQAYASRLGSTGGSDPRTPERLASVVGAACPLKRDRPGPVGRLWTAAEAGGFCGRAWVAFDDACPPGQRRTSAAHEVAFPLRLRQEFCEGQARRPRRPAEPKRYYGRTSDRRRRQEFCEGQARRPRRPAEPKRYYGRTSDRRRRQEFCEGQARRPRRPAEPKRYYGRTSDRRRPWRRRRWAGRNCRFRRGCSRVDALRIAD